MSDDPRLSNLLTYTTFHIGVYISLTTALIAASVLVAEINVTLLRFSSLCILLAGVFGGLIGSNIPQFKTYEELAGGRLSAFGVPIPKLTLTWAIHFEHFFFWLGILPLAGSFILCGPSALK